MPMNKPAIDDLLANIPSYYEMTVASALRARQIKEVNKEHPQPLQTALEEVAEGKIEPYFEEEAAPVQTELALEAPTLALNGQAPGAPPATDAAAADAGTPPEVVPDLDGGITEPAA